MKRVPISPISRRIAAAFRRGPGAALIFAGFAQAFTPEAEAVLGILGERLDAGLLDQAAYDDFLSRLDEESDCAAWRETPYADASEDILAAMRQACPPAGVREASEARPQGPFPGRMTFGRTLRPRRDESPPPFWSGEMRTAGAGAQASFRDGCPYRRRVEAWGPAGPQGPGPAGAHWSLRAGHDPVFRGTRLDFVSGRPAFPGGPWRAGPAGPWGSEHSGLDGMGAALRGPEGEAGGFATWNRSHPRGNGAPPRMDAMAYSLGLARRGAGLMWRGQTLHQRWETAGGPARAATVAGLEVSDRENPAATPRRWRLGLGISYADIRPGHAREAGGYAEFGWGADQGKYGRYSLRIAQAGTGWANPLQARAGLLPDTLQATLPIPGRGEGDCSLRSRIPILERGGYRLETATAGGAAWSAESRRLLTGEGNLALIQAWGPWKHEIGSGLRYRDPGLAPSTVGPAGSGQFLTWHRGTWQAGASLLHRGGSYRGAAPEPFTASLARRRQGNSWKADLLTGRLGQPLGYLRLSLYQQWDLGRGVVLGQTLRLPWSEGRLGGDMGYQVRVDWAGP